MLLVVLRAPKRSVSPTCALSPEQLVPTHLDTSHLTGTDPSTDAHSLPTTDQNANSSSSREVDWQVAASLAEEGAILQWLHPSFVVSLGAGASPSGILHRSSGDRGGCSQNHSPSSHRLSAHERNTGLSFDNMLPKGARESRSGLHCNAADAAAAFFGTCLQRGLPRVSPISMSDATGQGLSPAYSSHIALQAASTAAPGMPRKEGMPQKRSSLGGQLPSMRREMEDEGGSAPPGLSRLAPKPVALEASSRQQEQEQEQQQQQQLLPGQLGSAARLDGNVSDYPARLDGSVSEYPAPPLRCSSPQSSLPSGTATHKSSSPLLTNLAGRRSMRVPSLLSVSSGFGGAGPEVREGVGRWSGGGWGTVHEGAAPPGLHNRRINRLQVGGRAFRLLLKQTANGITME